MLELQLLSFLSYLGKINRGGKIPPPRLGLSIRIHRFKGRLSDLPTQLKILTPKQMFQRLPTALAQVKATNTSENLLNEIRQIIYSLSRAKEITKKVYSNINNSIKL